MKRHFIWAIGILLCSGCMKQGAFKGEAWEYHRNPAAVGFEQKQLDELTAYLDANEGTTGMVAIYKGKVIYEYGDLDTVSYVASVRKSVLSMLYGKYVEDGSIDLGKTVAELGLDDTLGLLPVEKQATVYDLITSRSGVYHPAANGGYDESFADRRGQYQPGEVFVYNNWDFNVAGHVFETLAKKDIYAAMEEQLAIPLGFQDWHIDNQKKRHNDSKSLYPAYHMYISTRDMAKIGQLMLQKGRWKDEQLISTDWVESITRVVTPIDQVGGQQGGPDNAIPEMAYSTMWWNFDAIKGDKRFAGSYTASGYGAQYITIVPKVDLVIAHKVKLNPLQLIGWMNDPVSPYSYYAMVKKLVDASNVGITDVVAR